MDYNITDNKTFSFYAQGNLSDRTAWNELEQNNLSLGGNLNNLILREENDTRQSNNFESGISYDYTIDTLGQHIFTSFSFSRDERDQLENFQQNFFNAANEVVSENLLTQTNERPQTSNLFVFQSDYEKPFANGGSLEAGIKGTFSEWNRIQEFRQGDESTNFLPVRNDSICDGFNFKEDVFAAYTSYSSNINKFGYQFGLRGEYTETISLQDRNNRTVMNNYFNLFPSLYLSYDMGDEESLTANYSRRISRPNL